MSTQSPQSPLSYADVKAAADRIAGHVRPVALAPGGQRSGPQAGPQTGPQAGPQDGPDLALEFLQHTGTFKARGAQNFLLAHREAGTLPDTGVTVASGGNAGLANAWAAGRLGVPATVFVPETAPAVKVARLRGYGAEVRLAGTQYAESAAACEEFAARTGALRSHAYDHPLVAAGAGTLVDEILTAAPSSGVPDTLVVSVGGGGLFAGVATAAHHHGIRTVAVEPEHSRALHAALEAGEVVDVTVDSVAADSLGARRATPLALEAARASGAASVLVPDAAITGARRALWDERRVAVEHAAATALAALTCGAYVPEDGERVTVVLCGANTDPSDLAS